MRYQNWDILIFPDQCKIPLQEFKTTCQVIQDPESHNQHNSPFLLPTVTSFIPGLQAGASFRISIHSWQTPEITRTTQSLSKPSDLIVFEARLFIDGRISGSKWFNQNGPWPSIIEATIDLDKNGEFEKLKFPTFHKELLSQSYWNAGDDLGRIKLVISEGFSRDNLTYPFERVKNIVSFSFQHAPLDVLESSSIAWPNAAMWRQVSLLAPYFAQHISPQQFSDGVEAHSHSPRHTTTSSRPAMPVPSVSAMDPPNVPVFPRQPAYDPFTEHVHSAFKGWRQTSSADVSMPDYSSSNTRASSSRQVTDPMILSERQGYGFESMQMPGAYESICEALQPSVPANTPQNAEDTPVMCTAAQKPSLKELPKRTPINADVNPEEMNANPTLPFAAPVTSNIKSRKENIIDSPHGAELNYVGNEGVPIKVVHPFSTTNNSGSKRQRVVTPAASKVIDEEDEPRSSPSLRKVSRYTKPDAKESGERRALSGIENV